MDEHLPEHLFLSSEWIFFNQLLVGQNEDASVSSSHHLHNEKTGFQADVSRLQNLHADLVAKLP